VTSSQQQKNHILPLTSPTQPRKVYISNPKNPPKNEVPIEYQPLKDTSLLRLIDIMRFFRLTLLFSIAGLSLAKPCNDNNPGANECVRYYGGGGCNNELGNYTPTCQGNCFVYVMIPFSSLKDSSLFQT
jgi:hypothetical protein